MPQPDSPISAIFSPWVICSDGTRRRKVIAPDSRSRIVAQVVDDGLAGFGDVSPREFLSFVVLRADVFRLRWPTFASPSFLFAQRKNQRKRPPRLWSSSAAAVPALLGQNRRCGTRDLRRLRRTRLFPG